LQSAQAQLAKTILRTPIAGTVNDVSVNTGDFIGGFTQVAEVANNGSLEVVFFVTEQEALTLQVGQTITINGQATGSIVSIAPAVNQATQKTEVRATVSDQSLTNGANVTVRPVAATETTMVDDTIWLPINAVRFTASEGAVFVIENGVLELVPVSLGAIRGSTVEITSGISQTDAVVSDARGLTPGQAVTTE
jgi:multidrug efflux system membrane fusion protein